MDTQTRTLTEDQIDMVSGGIKGAIEGKCTAAGDDKPENSALGYALIALAIVLL